MCKLNIAPQLSVQGETSMTDYILFWFARILAELMFVVLTFGGIVSLVAIITMWGRRK